MSKSIGYGILCAQVISVGMLARDDMPPELALMLFAIFNLALTALGVCLIRERR